MSNVRLGVIMPIPELANRKQKAVLWQATGVDSYGQFTIGAAAEIDVRWETTKTNVRDSQSNIIGIDASVFTSIDIPIGSILWLGTLANWNATGHTSTDSQLMEVKDSIIVPDIKSRATTRKVGLARYRNTLPTTT